MVKATRSLASLALLAIPLTAGAHPSDAANMSFFAGLLHPLLGADHVLAALAVGCMAGWSADRTRWLLPLMFVSSMGVGVSTVAGAPAIAVTEILVSASVLTLGVLLALNASTRTYPWIAVVGAFGWFHGQAHGAALSAGTGALTYAAGVLLSTALLHAAGFGLAASVLRDSRRAVLRAGGVGMALAGAVWIVAAA